MAKPRSPRRDTEAEDYTPLSRCPECAERDPDRRTAHHLSIVRAADLDTLRAHLTEQYVKLREEAKQRPDVVDDICRWAANVIDQFSNMADPQTGAVLPWWEARRLMGLERDRIAKATYTKAPEKYKARAEGREVTGFSRVKAPIGTPFPEEELVPAPSHILEPDEMEYTPEEDC